MNRLRAACLVALHLACAGTADAQIVTAAPPSAPAANLWLVVPFENANREQRIYWMGEGAAVILSDALLAAGVPAITREDRVRAFERLRVPIVASLSHATIIRLGQVVGAARVIVGAFELQRDELTVRVRAIELDSGRMAPEIVERGPVGDTFAIVDRIVRRLVSDSETAADPRERDGPSLAAFEQYIKGVLADSPAAKISFLNQALRLHPGFQRVRVALWSAHTELSEHQAALNVVRFVPAEHRLTRQAQFLAGISLLHLGQYQQAYDAFLTLHRQSPDAALLNNVGIVQLRRPTLAAGRRASEYFADAVDADDSDPDLVFNLGYALWREGRIHAAIDALREAVRRSPADDAAHYVLGVALQAAGSGAEAAREKDLARRLSSAHAEWEAKQPGVNAAPDGLERLKADIDVPAALRVEHVIVTAEQRDQRQLAAIHLEAGRRLFDAERDAEAIAELRRAVYLSPYQNEAHLLLGRVYLRAGRVQDAIDALTISIWSADTIPARLALAEAYVQAREFDSARLELDEVARRAPENTDLRRLLDGLP